MRDVYISLGFFLFSAVALCLWTKLGYDMLLTSIGMTGTGAAPASFIVGAVWGIIFAVLSAWFYSAGNAATEEISRARRLDG